jgi:hypothetical protein
MKLEIHSQNVRNALLAYIGNTLSPSDRAEFDRLMLEDEAFSQQVEEAEFTLTEDFADNTLTADEQAMVSGWIGCSPERRRRAEIAAAFRERAKAVAADHRRRASRSLKRSFLPLWFWGFGAAASVAVFVAVSLLHHRRSAAPVVAELSHAPLIKSQPVGENTILLEARRFRGSGIDNTTSMTYTLHSGMKTRIQIVVPEASASAVYSIDLRQASPGHTSAPVHVNRLGVNRTNSLLYLSFSLPAGSLPPGPYTGDLHSTEGSYHLHFLVANADN